MSCQLRKPKRGQAVDGYGGDENTKEEYLCGIRCNQEDKYFQSHSSTEQRFLNAVLYEEILPEEKVEHYKKKQAKRQLKYAILEKEWVKSSRRY